MFGAMARIRRMNPIYRSVNAAFIDSVTEGAPNLVPASEAIHDVALTEAAYRSIEEETIIHLD